MAKGDNITFTITGVAEIQRAYRELPKKVARKVVNTAIRTAVKGIASHVKDLTPRSAGGGALAKSTKVKARAKRKRGTIAIDVIQTTKGKGGIFYGGFVNFGTGSNKARVRFAGKTVGYKGASGSGGQEGRHYFEKAFDDTKDEAAATAARLIAAGIAIEARSLGLGT